MKKLIALLLLSMCFWSCQKKTSTTKDIPSNTIVGKYKGRFQHCEAVGCYDVDTTFTIEQINDKTFVRFGNINEEITNPGLWLSTESNYEILSTQIIWSDSTHTSGAYTISGHFIHDSMFMEFSQPIIPATYYKNMLSGKKQ